MAICKQWEMTCFVAYISSSFQSQSTLFWELFKWEKICNSVQIEGIVMFNITKKILQNITKNIYLHIFWFVYAVNYSS